MPSSHTHTHRVFPPALTWIGVLILGSGLSHSVAPSALASTPGVSSATTSFLAFDTKEGVFVGGQRRDFPTGVQGFGQGAFSSLGSLAMERGVSVEDNQRDEYVGSATSIGPNPGGISSWQNTGMFFPQHDQTLLLTNTVGLNGDTTTWSTRIESLLSGSMTNNRIVWDARLAESFVPVYTTQAGGVLLVSDSSGTHPTVAIKATSTAGDLVWGGPGGFLTPLTNGSRTPTVYVHSVSSLDFTLSVVVTLIDHDPCSATVALTLAGSVAGVVGSTSETLTSCLGAPAWSASAGATSTLGLALLPPARELSSNQIRVLEIWGLPDGATAEEISGTNASLSFALEVSDTTEPGSYPVSLLLRTVTTIGGVKSFSEPFTSSGNLTITPVVIPEPEAVEDREAEISAPPPATRSSGSSATPSVTSREEAVPKALKPVKLPEADAIEPLLSPVIPLSDSAPEPDPEPVPKASEPSVVEPPTPAAASALLGVTMVGALALGTLFAMLKRRRNRSSN